MTSRSVFQPPRFSCRFLRHWRCYCASGGPLTAITPPNGDTTTFSYDPKGRLTASLYPPEIGSDTLARTDVPVPGGGSGYEVTHTTGEGVETRYRVEKQSTGAEVRATIYPDGTASTAAIGVDGTRTETARTGTVQVSVPSPDDRFGMQSPTYETTITTPVDNLTATVVETREAELTDPLDPLSLTSYTETISVNGRAIERRYDPVTRTFTDTSPAGRIERTVVDEDGRPVEQQIGDLEPVAFAYDQDGRLTAMTRGTAPDTRASTLSYDAGGNVESVTDVLDRTVGFGYDASGRVTMQTLPGGAEIQLSYDQNGNLTSVTPPGRPAHLFFYDPASRPVRYHPPDPTPGLVEKRTFYQYNLAGQLARVTRPDGQSIFFDYDLETGDLIAQVLPTGQRSFFYDDTTGSLERIAFPGGELAYTYDGSLPKSETWSGDVAGTVSRTYDSSFRVASDSINGAHTVSYTYDDDDLVVQAGPLEIDRDPETGLVASTTLGVVDETYGYNDFGELTSHVAEIDEVPVFAATYVRDALGRIEEKTETIEGTTGSNPSS